MAIECIGINLPDTEENIYSKARFKGKDGKAGDNHCGAGLEGKLHGGKRSGELKCVTRIDLEDLADLGGEMKVKPKPPLR